jgi:putative Mg2+ transporter-C (MgtC) family protein
MAESRVVPRRGPPSLWAEGFGYAQTMPIDDQLAIVGRLAFAAALGAFIGLERELRGYPAGVRTVALVALGAALFTDVGQLLGGDDRVAAGIVTGIGFLGAGVIFRERGYAVQGITTAATIWSAAAVGMAVGRELYLVAGLGAVLVFLLLEARPVVRRLDDLARGRLHESVAQEDPNREGTENDR